MPPLILPLIVISIALFGLFYASIRQAKSIHNQRTKEKQGEFNESSLYDKSELMFFNFVRAIVITLVIIAIVSGYFIKLSIEGGLFTQVLGMFFVLFISCAFLFITGKAVAETKILTKADAKCLDYVYISFGAVGFIGLTLETTSIAQNHFLFPYIASFSLIATAIRLTKTAIEVELEQK